jgi:tetratricopeptide (TPR) repeat protein
MTDGTDGQLARLLQYLKSDPDNPNLLTDAAQAAIDAGDLDCATQLDQHLLAIVPDSFEGRYLASVIAMRRSDFASSIGLLERLIGENDQPSIRFNLAWSKAMLGDKAASLDLLDDRTTTEIAGGAMLKLQLMHEAGLFDEAMEFGSAALEQHPEDAGLFAAMATLAIDMEDVELARTCALKAGDHPEALAASGMLDLQDGLIENANAMFERSLAMRPHNPRAWIGRGLAGLMRQDNAQAAMDLDRGAQQFGSHIGSWIAAGWGHFIAGDSAAAEERFARALAIDPTFAESHGSLAVIDVTRGRPQDARRKITVALRLDKQCFSAALAQVLLSSGDPATAQEIINRAMNTPINEQGMTIAGYMTGLSRPTVH